MRALRAVSEKARVLETRDSPLMKNLREYLREYLPLRQLDRDHDGESISSSHKRRRRHWNVQEFEL